MRVAILGNNALAVPALVMLAQQGHVVGVGTPDQPNEGVERIQMVAQSAQLPFRQFSQYTVNVELPAWLQSIDAEVVFVMTWPWKIPPVVLAKPTLGFINFHFALLPNYRGAEPTFWEIRNRESHGAVSVHQMDEGWDTGPVAHIEKVPILPTDTHGQHMVNLGMSGANAAANIIGKLATGTLQFAPQDESQARYLPKPGFADLVLDFDQMDAAEAMAMVNAANPWNKGAFTGLRGMPIKITAVSIPTSAPEIPGTARPGMIVGNGRQLFVLCKGNEPLHVEIVSLDQGILPGYRLFELGIQPGELLQRLW